MRCESPCEGLCHDGGCAPKPPGNEHGTAERRESDFSPFAQRLIDRGKLEGLREGKLEGEIKGKLEGEIAGKLEGTRGVLLRLVARAGIAFSEDDRARVRDCTDLATLDRWIDNIRDAKTAADVLS
jgi:hypothetical protein